MHNHAASSNKTLRDLGKVAITLIACGAVFSGAAVAYFTANGTAQNTFTIYGGGNGETLAIQVEEPAWNPDDDHTVLPGTEFAKNPRVTNIEGVDAYAFLKVSIPLGTVDGKPNSPLFFLNNLNTGTDPTQWTSMRSWEDEGAKHEVFSYNNTVAKGQSTTALFDSVRFDPAITSSDAKALDTTVAIDVDAFSVQKSGIPSAAAALELSGWTSN